jgi:hypothetical protein
VLLWRRGLPQPLGVKKVDYESRINTALGKILRYFNFLELNLGLCLRALAHPNDISASHGLLRRAGMPETINRLGKLLAECEHIPDISAFEKWAMRAEEIRPLRNYYVHATWDYLPLRKEAPLVFRIPPWRTEQIEGSSEGAMRIEDLEKDAKSIEAAFEEFMTIRRKYGV